MKTQLRVVGSDDPTPRHYNPTYEEWVEDLRGIVWNAFIKGHMSLEEIAVKADLTPITVHKFAWAVTKQPKARTTYQLAAAVGFRIPFLHADAPRQPDEPELSEFRKLIQRKV